MPKVLPDPLLRASSSAFPAPNSREGLYTISLHFKSISSLFHVSRPLRQFPALFLKPSHDNTASSARLAVENAAPLKTIRKEPSGRLFSVQRQLMLLEDQVEASKITIRLLNLHLPARSS